jgi:4,5-DOPA dioxygenase extradiol
VAKHDTNEGERDRREDDERQLEGAELRDDLAAEVAEVVKPHWVGADHDQWGLDHGTWSVMTHLFPQADIPVVQLSIDALKPLDYHFDLATKLSELRKRGVLIVSSGNVVHNLRRIERDRPDAGADWARRFDDMVARQITEAPGNILAATKHPDYDMAVPTPDHFIPLLYTAGLAAENTDARALLRGYALGSLSMTCYGIGMKGIACEEAEGGAEMPEGVPPDRTNI